jgi:hypothetical protein
MGYIGKAPTDVPLVAGDIGDDAIDSQHYAAGSIDTAHLADDQITLAKMASGTDGNIISYDASGDPVAIATGTDGQVLTSAGAGAPPVFEDAGGGAWNLIGTAEASNSASLTITGLDATYDTYAMVFSAMHPSTNGANPYFRCGDSAGIDTSGYAASGVNHLDSTATLSAFQQTSGSYVRLSYDVGNSAGKVFGGVHYLHCPNDDGAFPVFTGLSTNVTAAGRFSSHWMSYARTTAIVLDRVQVYFSTGNIVSGRFSVFGISHT